MASREMLPDPLPAIHCGLCRTTIKDPDTPGVASEYITGDIRGLCRGCLDFVVTFSMTESLEEAETLIKDKEIKIRFQSLKDKLEAL